MSAVRRAPTSAGQSAKAASSLLIGQPLVAGLDFDQIQRYALAARLLDRMLRSHNGPVRILEVGCNELNLLPRFLDPERVQVIRCDVEKFGDAPDFVLIERERPLPFAADSFHAVVALEVLEHLPGRDRSSFVADCLRVAREGMVFSCPNGIPETIEAEKLAGQTYQERNGRPHPFLQEHELYAIPTEEEVREILGGLECSFAVFDNAPLDVWLAMLFLSETLSEQTASAEVRELLSSRGSALLGKSTAPPYRKMYVCTKTFDASAALEPLPESERARQSASEPIAKAIAHAVGVTCAALEENQKTHQAAVAAYQEKIEILQQRSRRDQGEIEDYRQRQPILHSLLKSLTGSRKWKLLQPVRSLRQLIRPRAVGIGDLLPVRQLMPAADVRDGTWSAQGPDPQFLAPCLFPRGWLRIRLSMQANTQGRLEIYADTGLGFREGILLERVEVHDRIDRDLYVHLDRPACALRFDPLDVEGEFRLDQFRIEHVPGLKVAVSALTRKIRLLFQYGVFGRTLKNGLRLFLRGDLGLIRDKILLGLSRSAFEVPEDYDDNVAYTHWRARHALTNADREAMQKESQTMANPPVISVLMPVFNAPAEYLILAIESVLKQIYPHWELCIADDASTEEHVAPILKEYAAKDPRIRVVFRNANGNIAAASNSALELARGDYIALLDQDDELAEHALFRMAKTVVADRSLDFIYSDEDKLNTDGKHVEAFFKPDWSPEYFLTCMYTCHLGVYRTSLVRKIGGFRSEFDTAQDYDMVLRLVAHTQRIAHVADVLYHWRKLPTSTAATHAAKPTSAITAQRAVQSYLDSIGKNATAVPGPYTGLHRVRHAIVGNPLISIIIPSAGKPVRIRGRQTSFLAMCIESIRNLSSYKNYEIVVVDNDDLSPFLQKQLKSLGARCVSYTEPFNLSCKMNLGAARARGDYLLFLNDDIEVISPDWLEAMLEHAQDPDIGAVGAKLVFRDGRLQHVGVVILEGEPGHAYYGSAGDHPGYYASNLVTRNYSAVTGACLMTRASVFRELGGFARELSLNYNDVDFCLRLREKGLRIVHTPYARLYHHESASKSGVYRAELDLFQTRWAGKWIRDPYYNPHLSSRHNDFRIATDDPEMVVKEG